MKFGGSKTTEVHQERRARPWRAPGGGLDAIIKTPSPPQKTKHLAATKSGGTTDRVTADQRYNGARYSEA